MIDRVRQECIQVCIPMSIQRPMENTAILLMTCCYMLCKAQQGQMFNFNN